MTSPAPAEPRHSGPKKRPLERRLFLVAFLALALPAALLAWVVFGAADGGNADLNEAQWERVVRQFGRAARAGAGPAPTAGSSAGSTTDRSARAPAASPPESESAAAPPAATSSSAPVAGGRSTPPSATPAAGQPPTQGRRVPPPELDPEVRERQQRAYSADRPKNVVDLQQFRTSDSVDISDGAGRRGAATLINLNPDINSWYLLQLRWSGESEARSYHLANSSPQGQSLVLDDGFPYGLRIASTTADVACDLWSASNELRLETAAARNTPYVMLCDERVALRLKTSGRRTTMERATDFLRDTIPGGESITVFVRRAFFQDAFLSTAELAEVADRATQGTAPGMPLPARLADGVAGRLLDQLELGLTVEGSDRGRLAVGEWYPVAGNRGTFASAIRPDLIAPEILASHSGTVVRLDEVESHALAYLAAFDLAHYDIAFSRGTDHPRLGWSDRVPEERRDTSLPGPDGIDSVEPLVSTGIIPAAVAGRAVATFTGGFKRTHGGFLYGELAMVNHGSHYGFIEEGVVFSKLQPGLATVFVLDDGRLEMKTWSAEDNELLPRIRYARQNGVPVIERDRDGEGVPGAFVSRYGAGNWSGSQEGKYRTLRAGVCLQETATTRFLIYAYFSSATPSAMARVFQAYGCGYGMLLDMNALEHTYMAVYTLRGSAIDVQHLVKGMEVLDKEERGHLLPRFLGFADNRDFFSVLRREPREGRGTEVGS